MTAFPISLASLREKSAVRRQRLVVTYNDFSRNQGGGSGAFLVSPSGQQEEIFIASPRESYGTVILTDIDNRREYLIFVSRRDCYSRKISVGWRFGDLFARSWTF